MTWRATHHTPERVIHRSNHAEWADAVAWLRTKIADAATPGLRMATRLLGSLDMGEHFDLTIDGHRYQLQGGRR